jgi:hypothetical protein
MTGSVRELLEKKDPNPDPKKENLVKRILERVKEKDNKVPAMIRFARLDAVYYSRKLGKSERRYVFASNLAEVWDVRVRDAAILSGHTFDKGDSVYIWVFLPSLPHEVIPATWGHVLSHLPTWLSKIDNN